jgi:hypothetical protein
LHLNSLRLEQRARHEWGRPVDAMCGVRIQQQRRLCALRVEVQLLQSGGSWAAAEVQGARMTREKADEGDGISDTDAAAPLE